MAAPCEHMAIADPFRKLFENDAEEEKTVFHKGARACLIIMLTMVQHSPLWVNFLNGSSISTPEEFNSAHPSIDDCIDPMDVLIKYHNAIALTFRIRGPEKYGEVRGPRR
jgi:hypothetical protein